MLFQKGIRKGIQKGIQPKGGPKGNPKGDPKAEWEKWRKVKMDEFFMQCSTYIYGNSISNMAMLVTGTCYYSKIKSLGMLQTGTCHKTRRASACYTIWNLITSALIGKSSMQCPVVLTKRPINQFISSAKQKTGIKSLMSWFIYAVPMCYAQIHISLIRGRKCSKKIH